MVVRDAKQEGALGAFAPEAGQRLPQRQRDLLHQVVAFGPVAAITARQTPQRRQVGVQQRQVVVLALEDLDYAEIAAVLGISENNVGVRLNRARAALRKLMGERT